MYFKNRLGELRWVVILSARSEDEDAEAENGYTSFQYY